MRGSSTGCLAARPVLDRRWLSRKTSMAVLPDNLNHDAPFDVGFAAGVTRLAGSCVTVAVPWLGGNRREEIFAQAMPVSSEHGLKLYKAGGFWIGHVRGTSAQHDLSAATELAYNRLLKVCTGRHLLRIWNYVPGINEEANGLENYRAFCQGRAQAFESALGIGFNAQLPSASAVGSSGDHLDVIFVAGQAAPVHYENPAQTPAYLYPIEHGPRSPSFARASVVKDGAQVWTFISGTSAIRGHATIAPGTLAGQLDCTLENLALISAAAGLGQDLGADRSQRRHFKVYLRNANDLPATQQRLERSLLRPSDDVIFLLADICRAALKVEIEATVVI
jgi:chorismate lyase/3-hydroxybenzoate synthase